jgi:dipeptidyl aminopeptidase/acylaminoacyl peptidase
VRSSCNPSIVAALAASLVVAGPLAAQRQPASAIDYYKLINVGNPAMAPSGRSVAFTVTTVVEEKDKRHNEVWLAATDGSSAPYRATSPGTEASNPVWSPDGSLLAFTSKRDGALGDDATTWFLRTSSAGEAFQVPGVNGSPVFSPDGRTIAYLWRGPQPDSAHRDKRFGWVSANAITRGADPHRFDGRVITYLPFKGDERGYLADPASTPPTHLYVVPATGGVPRALTSGELSQSQAAWSPDGRTIAFVQDSTDPDQLRDDADPDLWTVDVAGGATTRLTSNHGYEREPRFSPDGHSIAYLCSHGRNMPTAVCVMPATGGDARDLTSPWSYDPTALAWSPDGRYLTFTAEFEGSAHRFRVAARGGQVEQVTHGLRQLGGFSASGDGRMVAYTGTDVTHPLELFVASGDGAGERRLTSFNDAYIAQADMISADTIWYRGPGNMAIEGFLMKPRGWQAGQKYPLVLYIHGGPHSQYGHVYFHEFQMLAGQGYWVLFTNPRGSTGYGHDFTYASRGRWGMEDYQDLMLGVDEVIRRTGQVDTTRLAVAGGSYGGFMTNWILGHTHRFHVAETDRSISNWFSWYGSSDAQGLTDWEFYGPPWEQDSLYTALSPLRFARTITTPLLIVHSEDDFRVPITDAEQLYLNLRRRRVPVEFVRYPRSFHGLSRTGPPWLLVDRLERIRTWFAHWMAADTAAAASR